MASYKSARTGGLAGVFILLICLLAGCLGGNTAEEAANVVTGQASSHPNAASGRSEHFDISIGYWDIRELFEEPEKDAFLQKIMKDFNITIHPVEVSWSDYQERYRIMAATGQLPDISANNHVNTPVYEDWVKQGIIRPIPEELDNYPNVRQVMELSDVQYLKHNGRFYMIPRTSFIEDRNLYASNAALLVRKDWMDMLGIKDPENFDEFVEMLKAFTAGDPDGNGIDDTIGLSFNTRESMGKWVIMTIRPQFNTYTWVKDVDRYVPSWAAEGFIDVLVNMRRLYAEGVLYTDFATQSAYYGSEIFAKGKAGALEYQAAASGLQQIADQWDQYHPDQRFSEHVKLLHVFPAADGGLYHNTGTFYWSESYFSANVEDAKMERVLELYDYLMSPDGLKHLKLGIEGQDFIWKEEKLLITRPKDEKTGKWTDINSLYPSIRLFSPLAAWGGVSIEDFQLNDINLAYFDEDLVKMAKEEIEWNLKYAKPLPRPYEILAMNTVKSKFSSDYIRQDVIKVMLSKDDPVKAWREVLDRYVEEGMDEAIEDVNTRAFETASAKSQ